MPENTSLLARQFQVIRSLKRDKDLCRRFEKSVVSLAGDIIGNIDPEDLLDKGVRAVVDILPGGAGLFVKWKNEGNSIKVKTIYNLPQDNIKLSPANYFEPDKPRVISKPELLFAFLPQSTVFSHVFILPLNFHHEYFGTIILLAPRLNQQRADAYLPTLAAFVNIIAVSISNLLLLNRLTDTAKETVALNNISLTLNACLNLNDLLLTFIEETNNYMGTDAVAVHLWNEEKDKLTLKLSTGFSASSKILRNVSLNEGVIGWVAKNHQVLEIPNLKESPYFEEYQSSQGLNYLLIIPIISRNKLIGVLSYLSSSINKISDKNIASLLSLVNSVAVNIENVELYEKAKVLARYDSLTGLLNYREFQRILDKELARAKRYGHNLSLVMMDIDYFKNYNDNNGHTRGDTALKKIGKIISGAIRRLDIGFRYGGEEFSVLLLETEEREAFKVAERARRHLAATNFAGQENQPNGNLTISLGIASFPLDADNKNDLVNRADQALYRAKSLGRNQTRLYKDREAA